MTKDAQLKKVRCIKVLPIENDGKSTII